MADDPKKGFPPQTQPHPGFESRMQPRPEYGEAPYGALGRLKGKVALITGGDSGIGRAVVVAFAREGADVAFSYLSEHQDAEQTRREVEAAGRRVLAMPGDLASVEQCKAVVDQAVAQFGRIDVLINNAAFQGKAVERFEELDPDRVDYTFRVNIVAMFHLVRFALPHLRAGSSIINVASIQAYQPNPAILDYASTKGAIVTFTKGLSKELIGRGIRVNCVAPGPVWTPLIPQSFPEKKVEGFGQSAPIGRAAQPSELAPAFIFLASEEASYVNGEVLGVTGGELLG